MCNLALVVTSSYYIEKLYLYFLNKPNKLTTDTKVGDKYCLFTLQLSLVRRPDIHLITLLRVATTMYMHLHYALHYFLFCSLSQSVILRDQVKNSIDLSLLLYGDCEVSFRLSGYNTKVGPFQFNS